MGRLSERTVLARKLYAEGKSVKEISKELNISYNSTHQMVKPLPSKRQIDKAINNIVHIQVNNEIYEVNLALAKKIQPLKVA